MSRSFDATLKHLLEAYPFDWVRLAGRSEAAEVQVVDVDLSTVSAEADKVIRIGGAEAMLLHLELQATYDPRMGRRLQRYNALLDYRHDLPVQSVVLLLRPEADGP